MVERVFRNEGLTRVANCNNKNVLRDCIAQLFGLCVIRAKSFSSVPPMKICIYSIAMFWKHVI